MTQKSKYQVKDLPLSTSDAPGKRIAYFRKQQGLTQAELAQKIGIDQSLLSAYERGRLHMNEEILVHIATALHISADDLLGLKKNNSDIQNISLRFIKRLLIIETFPEAQKKRILRNLDDYIKAYQK